MSEIDAKVVEYIASQAAEKAADKSIATVFLHLGIDVEDKETLKAFKENQIFLTSLRESKEQVTKAGKIALGTTLATGFIGLVWLGVKGTIYGWLAAVPRIG